MRFLGQALRMSAKIRLFEDANHAAKYAKYRPSYPPEVAEAIVEYHIQGGGGKGLAVDVACGSGQSTSPLAPHFEHVLGLDVSEAQISQAPKDLPNVQFKVSSAEDLNVLKDCSVDLITTAQAIHWFEFDVFYAEVHRVLKPKGTLAAYGYGIPELDREKGHNLIWTFYKETLKSGHYWDKRRQHIDDKYTEIKLPFEDLKRIDDYAIRMRMPVAGFMGYMESWSGYRSYMSKFPDSTVKQDLQNGVEEAYRDKLSGNVEEVMVTWPIFILLGRKGT